MLNCYGIKRSGQGHFETTDHDVHSVPQDTIMQEVHGFGHKDSSSETTATCSSRLVLWWALWLS